MPLGNELIPSIGQAAPIRPFVPAPPSLAGTHPAVAVFFAVLHIGAGIKAILDGETP